MTEKNDFFIYRKDDDGNLVYSICFNDNSLSAIYAEVFLYLADKGMF